MKRPALLLVLMLMLAPALGLAAPSEPVLNATVDRTRLFVGEQLVLTLTLKGPDVEYTGPFKVPDLMPYLWLVNTSGPSTSTQMSYTNGSFIKTGAISMSYWLQAKRAGEFTIPALAYAVNGVPVASSPIKIIIQEPVEAGVLPGGSEGGWRPPSDPYLQIKVDKNDPYVGEQITASWFIYFRRPIQQLAWVQMPGSADFMSKDLGTVSNPVPESKTIGGVTWQVAYLKGMAFFPIKAGDAVIDPVILDYAVASGRRDFFGNQVASRARLQSDPIAIHVRNLPEENKPPNFSGAVGTLKIQVTPASGAVLANEQFKFDLVVEGTANPDFITKPDIEVPDGFDLYTESVDKDQRAEKGSAVGVKHFKMILVPHQTGKFTLPPFTLPYFNPETGKYAVARSAQINLLVNPGKAPEEPIVTTEPALPFKEVGTDVRYIKPDRSRLDNQTVWMMASPRMALAQLVPLAAVALALLVRRRSEKLTGDPAYARRIRASKNSRAALKAAGRAARAGDVHQTYAGAYRALVGFIADQYNLPDQGMTTADAAAALRGAGVSEEVVSETTAVLSECDRARYAGAEMSAEAASVVKRVEDLIARIGKESGT